MIIKYQKMPIQKYWKPDEDKLLVALVRKYKKNPAWLKISAQLKRQKIFKNAKQCKRRYQNHLASYINNSKLSTEEQQRLYAYFRVHGNSWKHISTLYKNRTDSIIKNTFFSMIRKCVRKMNGLTSWQVNNKIINKSVPKVISEFLELGSRTGFSPPFKIVDIVQVFIDHLEEGPAELGSETLRAQVGHAIELFKGLKQDKTKKMAKRKKIKKQRKTSQSEDEEEQQSLECFYLNGPYARRKRASRRQAQEGKSRTTLEEENEEEKGNKQYFNKIKISLQRSETKSTVVEAYSEHLVREILGKIRGFYYDLRSYGCLEKLVIESPHMAILNCFIDFTSFIRIYVLKTALMREVDVANALKKLIVSCSRLITVLSEAVLQEQRVHVSSLNQTIYACSGLYHFLSKCLSTGSDDASMKDCGAPEVTMTVGMQCEESEDQKKPRTTVSENRDINWS